MRFWVLNFFLGINFFIYNIRKILLRFLKNKKRNRKILKGKKIM